MHRLYHNTEQEEALEMVHNCEISTRVEWRLLIN